MPTSDLTVRTLYLRRPATLYPVSPSSTILISSPSGRRVRRRVGQSRGRWLRSHAEDGISALGCSRLIGIKTPNPLSDRTLHSLFRSTLIPEALISLSI